ncbi:MAG TPA: glycosyltransferase [Thermoanaerobaculia bacterium]|jgi:glycosyltransferase involved in cell wall biosynthesis|nr:glycosyltransferase [Thermoanaerobaculia bacterium]
MSPGQPTADNRQLRVAIIGPVFPYRAGIAYCTTRLAQVLDADVISFKRQFPRSLYPGSSDIDETLPRFERARFLLDIVNPITWLRTALLLRREKPDAVIFVWWVWVWAIPYLVLLSLLPKRTRVILQCHNIGDKEPAAWKRILTNLVLRRGDVLVVHAKTEAEDAARRLGLSTPHPPLAPSLLSKGEKAAPRIVQTFLPVHELGGAIPSREDARRTLGLDGNVALFFGHVRPFKGLDIALNAWRQLTTNVTLVVAGEAWWKGEEEYRAIAQGLTNVRLDFRFIPDSEIATYFAATDVVLAPYRIEAQSGVALTAFHFARPVIATNVGGLPEIIDEGANGMLVPPENPTALAQAIDTFFAREDRATMERHAAASARRYSWEEYGALMKRLLAGE